MGLCAGKLHASVCIKGRLRGAGAFRLSSVHEGGNEYFHHADVRVLFLRHFASVEPISDSAHTLSVINDAMDQLDALKEDHFMDENGRDIALTNHDIAFSHVDFGYDERKILKDVSFTIPEKTSTAIVGPSGSGKTTICSLLARFYDVNDGSITVGGVDVRKMTCESLLSNISMVFQNVYLFHDTIRANICFGKTDATEEEMTDAAKRHAATISLWHCRTATTP